VTKFVRIYLVSAKFRVNQTHEICTGGGNRSIGGLRRIAAGIRKNSAQWRMEQRKCRGNRCNPMKSRGILDEGSISPWELERRALPRASTSGLSSVTALNAGAYFVHFGPGVAFLCSSYVKRVEDMVSLFIHPGILSFLQYLQTWRRARYHEDRYRLRKKVINQ
jgi:hypothetical protein